MATSHPQAYFDSEQVLASSPELDPGRLLDALPRGAGLRVNTIEGIGLVAARRVGDFTHVVAGLDAVVPVELSGWQTDDGDFEDMRTRPVDLGFLADAPPGVATRLLDAALAGPVVFSEPDEELRRAWIAWLTYAVPDGAALTFSTAGDEGARVRVADEPGAIDTTEPCDLNPSLYARVAVQLAARGELHAAVARLDEPDGLALAVHGGATELIAPHHLPLALQLITELATAGEVREAARAAAALPTGAASTSMVLREPEKILLPDIVEPEPEPILEADVVEEPEPEPISEDEPVAVPFEPAAVAAPEAIEEPEPVEEPLPDADAWSSLLAELKTESVQPDQNLPVLPDIEELRHRDRMRAEPEPAEPEPVADEPAETTYELGISLDAFAASLHAAPEPEPEQVAEEVLEEQELGMSLAELEESLKREKGA